MNAKQFKRGGRCGGVVLMEVIIALGIFALVSLGLVTALDKAFDIARDRNAVEESARVIQNQLALLHGEPLVPGERDVEADANGISCHLAIAPEPMHDQRKRPMVGIYRATVTAAWKQDGQSESRTISELFYQP